MIPLAWGEVEALRLGRLERPAAGPPGASAGASGRGGDTITAVRADSRAVEAGELFVALNSGIAYVADAQARGAATLIPDDQHAALAALASLVRSKSRARVVAIVGSTGKTTTKDMLGALCAAVVPTVYPVESLNNEIGLPLTVLGLEPDTEILITEMGMRGLGQIAELAAVALPQVALVTGIGPEHLEQVGTVGDVARANAEAIDALPSGGTAIVPAAAAELEPFLTRDDIEIVRFDAVQIRLDGSRAEFDLGGERVAVTLPSARRHLADNMLAALTAYKALGLPLDRVHEGASRIRLSRWRGDELALPGGGFVVNDAYNANPTSMRAALLDLAERARARRRVAVLGEMAELGADSDRYHREIGEVVAETVDVLVAVGVRARLYAQAGVPEVHEVETLEEAQDVVEAVVRPGDAVLVKASRAVGLEGVPERIAKLAGAWSVS